MQIVKQERSRINAGRCFVKAAGEHVMPHRGSSTLSDTAEVAAGILIAAIFAGKRIRVRTSSESLLCPQLFCRLANAAFTFGVIVNGWMMCGFRGQPDGFEPPASNGGFANGLQICDVRFNRCLPDNV